MWKLFKSYEDIAIGFASFISVAVVFALFFWVMAIVLNDISVANAPAPGANASQTFDLNEARQLNLKGQASIE